MKKQSKLMTFLMSLLLVFMLAVPGNAVSTQAAGQGDMAVHFIDVGQGLAILVQSGGENLLYDGGNRAHADEVVQYLIMMKTTWVDWSNVWIILKWNMCWVLIMYILQICLIHL